MKDMRHMDSRGFKWGKRRCCIIEFNKTMQRPFQEKCYSTRKHGLQWHIMKSLRERVILWGETEWFLFARKRLLFINNGTLVHDPVMI